ncbi:MAG: UDP-N-acetylmuramoyl-L-alanine--D-glutamate ligase [Clostridia bacterium]|nr:UDP-N-acetylmuramoyl-L-alanine--D-glutamate ligase [Clostridia bacterium]
MSTSCKKACILGIGKSGLASYRLLRDEGVDVCVYDDNVSDCDLPMLRSTEDIKNCDMVVVSPGFDFGHEILRYSISQGVEVVSEIELAYRYSLCDLIAVTGTNGKTSTTKMIDTMLRYAGIDVYTGGNIGVPFSEFCKKMTITDVGVLEVSSFQLEHTSTFHPHIAVMLNITPDHLDRHGGFDNYVLAKKKIFDNMQDADYIIANYDDEIVRNCLKDTNATIFWLSLHTKQKTGVFRDRDRYIYAEYGRYRPIGNHEDTDGITNEYNVMAVYAIAGILNIPFYTALRAIRHLDKGRYNMRETASVNSIKFVNDSKATNTASVLNDVRYLDGEYVLILGGRSKGENYQSFLQKLNSRHIFFVGENSAQLYDLAKKYSINCSLCQDLREAVTSAYQYCIDNSVHCVLFAPATASFDSYKNYQERGDEFDKIVEGLCLENYQ